MVPKLEKNHMHRERQSRVSGFKMFALCLSPLYNVKEISMFVSAPSLPNTIAVALILERTGSCGSQTFLFLYLLK